MQCTTCLLANLCVHVSALQRALVFNIDVTVQFRPTIINTCQSRVNLGLLQSPVCFEVICCWDHAQPAEET